MVQLRLGGLGLVWLVVLLPLLLLSLSTHVSASASTNNWAVLVCSVSETGFSTLQHADSPTRQSRFWFNYRVNYSARSARASIR